MRLSRSRRRRPAGGTWAEVAPGISARVYADEAEYRRHQAGKVETLDPGRLQAYHDEFRAVLAARLRRLPLEGAAVLCLGARTGAEVMAFLDCGAARALGVDLAPADGGLCGVRRGDFHHLEDWDESYDMVYTNSLDHARDLDRVVEEARRVLRPGGRFIVEAHLKRPGEFESIAWDDAHSLAQFLVSRGFWMEESYVFEAPWKGAQFVLEKR